MASARNFRRAFQQANVVTPLMGGLSIVAGVGALWKLTRPEYPPRSLAPELKPLPERIRKGLGDDEYYCEEVGATFPADEPPRKLPDLAKHESLLARVLKEKPSLYKYLRDRVTSNGVTVAKCIKTGIDNPSAADGGEVGIVAGDEESYETFKELFDIIIDRWHRGYPSHAKHTNDLDHHRIARTRIDPTGKYVISCCASAVRSIRGYKLPPGISFQERREVERLSTQALADLPADLHGHYHPLVGSRSLSAIEEDAASGATHGLGEFTHPQAGPVLSSGIGRHWPDARGVFRTEAGDLSVRVNNTDHLEFISQRMGDDVKSCFAKLAETLRSFETSLASQNREFMHNERLGYLSTCPSNLGTGLRVCVEMRIPNMIGRPDFEQIIRKLGLKARTDGCTDAFQHTRFIENLDVLGRSEVEIVDTVIEGCAELVEWEKVLERGRDITSELPR